MGDPHFVIFAQTLHQISKKIEIGDGSMAKFTDGQIHEASGTKHIGPVQGTQGHKPELLTATAGQGGGVGNLEFQHRVKYFDVDKSETKKLPWIGDIIQKEDELLTGTDYWQPEDFGEEDNHLYDKLNDIQQLRFHDKSFRILVGMNMEFNTKESWYNKGTDFIPEIGEFKNFDHFLDLTYKNFGKNERKIFMKSFVKILKRDLKKQEASLFDEILNHGIDRKKNILTGNYDLVPLDYRVEDDPEIQVFLWRFFLQRKLFYKRKIWEYSDYLYGEVHPIPVLFPPLDWEPSVARIELKYEGYKPPKRYFEAEENEVPERNKADKSKPKNEGKSEVAGDKKTEGKDIKVGDRRKVSFGKGSRQVGQSGAQAVDQVLAEPEEDEIIITDGVESADIYKKRFKTAINYGKNEYIGSEKPRKVSLWKDWGDLPLEMISGWNFMRKINPNMPRISNMKEYPKEDVKDMTPDALFRQLNALPKICQWQPKQEPGAKAKETVNYIKRDRIVAR